MKDLLSENEKLALAMNNANGQSGLIVDMKGTTAEELEKQKLVKDYNKEVEAYTEAYENHLTKLEEHTKKIAENIANIEIMPIGNYLLVKQFDENPFQRIVRDKKSGLIIDGGGMSPVFKNTDSGEWEQEKNFILVGVIQEVGPECKWCKPGDTIMYTKPSAVPVPFYKQGLILVNETRVLVTINEGLKERFDELKKN